MELSRPAAVADRASAETTTISETRIATKEANTVSGTNRNSPRCESVGNQGRLERSLDALHPDEVPRAARLHRDRKSTRLLQSPYDLVCRLLLEKKNTRTNKHARALRIETDVDLSIS